MLACMHTRRHARTHARTLISFVGHCVIPRAAIKWHPDKNRDNPEATERFQRVAEAYEVLCGDAKVICQFFSAEDFLYAGARFSCVLDRICVYVYSVFVDIPIFGIYIVNFVTATKKVHEDKQRLNE